MKSMKLSNYFEIINPTYQYIQITPHKSIRNYNSSNIAKAIAQTYRSIDKRIRREKKKIFFECYFKIAYMIDIQDNNASFYFIVPSKFVNNLLQKISEIWSKATINILDEKPKPFTDNAEIYQLGYKKEDALSLEVDKKSNEPLNSILSVMDIMQEDDRISVIYNFLPCSQFGWLERYTETMNKIKDKELIIKKQTGAEYLVKTTIVHIAKFFNTILQVINDFTGGDSNSEQESLYSSIIHVLEQQEKLSPSTKKKKEQMVLDTQIGIISESADDTRRNNNALSVCQAYRSLDEDNELLYKLKKMKQPIDVETVDLGLEINTFSTDEVSNFIQIPGRLLLTQFGIKHIKTEEVQIPEKLRSGYIHLGTNIYKGIETETFTEDHKDIGSLGLVLLAMQGGGKTTYLCNYAKNCSVRNESVVHIDFIRNNESSKTIEKTSDKPVIIDLSTEEGIQAFSYNEIEFNKNMSAFEKQSLANKKAEMTIQLIDAINDNGEPLSPKMARYLSASANIVYMGNNTTLKDVIRCLQDYKYREETIKNIPEILQEDFEEEILALGELDEYSKSTKDNPSTKCGTRDSKIEGILDRVSLLMRDFYLKKMYKKNPKDNINFAKLTEEGKTILIRMPQSKFKDYAKNVITTFFITKVWLACELRGELSDISKRTHIIVDEISQTKTAERFLESKLTQGRKFGFKPVLALQYLDQLDKKTIYSLKGAGCSFMLLKGAIKEDFEYFKDEINDTFEYEDLKDMCKTYKYPSLNIIQYSEGTSAFITKLPQPAS